MSAGCPPWCPSFALPGEGGSGSPSIVIAQPGSDGAGGSLSSLAPASLTPDVGLDGSEVFAVPHATRPNASSSLQVRISAPCHGRSDSAMGTSAKGQATRLRACRSAGPGTSHSTPRPCSRGDFGYEHARKLRYAVAFVRDAFARGGVRHSRDSGMAGSGIGSGRVRLFGAGSADFLACRAPLVARLLPW